MKTAIYIEDGVVQLVLTPENDWERSALKSFDIGADIETKIFNGAFYDCRGGWVRQREHYRTSPNGGETDDRSLIIRVVA